MEPVVSRRVAPRGEESVLLTIIFEERLAVQIQPAVAGDIGVAFLGLTDAEVYVYRPALASQESEKHQRAHQALAVTLEYSVAKKRVCEADRFVETCAVALSYRDSRI